MTDAHLFDPDPGSLFADVTWEACTHPDEVRLAAPQLVNVDDPGGLLTPPEPDDDGPAFACVDCGAALNVTTGHMSARGPLCNHHDDDGPGHEPAAELARADLFGDDGPAWPWWCHVCGGAVTFSPIDDRDGAMTAAGPIHHACEPEPDDEHRADDLDELDDADELDDDEPTPRGAPDLDPDRCAAYRWGFGDRGQCVRAPGHRTEASPHVYGWQIDLAANTGRADVSIGGWSTGCTWGDMDGTPPAAPDGSCLAYVENRDDRDDNDDDGPELPDDQHGAYAFRGACPCGWRGPTREDDHAEERAYFDAADHAHPGWRDLPALRALGYEPTKKRAAAYEHDRAALIPAGWTGPIRQHREHPCGHRWGDGWTSDRGAVPGRVAGNVEVCACPCHMTDDPDRWHATHAPDESAPADLASAAPALF